MRAAIIIATGEPIKVIKHRRIEYLWIAWRNLTEEYLENELEFKY